MNFNLSPQEEEFRQEIRAFFESEPTTEGARKEWDSGYGFGPCTWEILRKLGSRGWLAPSWPRRYGGLELPNIYRYIASDELDYYTHIYALVGAGMAGPIILRHGNEEQKQQYVPRIARGEIEFALGYTEPDAGSDLANLSIKAEDKGDYFLINGQKMFNTRAHYAQYHWLGARTQVVEPKHRGISLFIVDLKSPGITVNPIWTIAGFRTNEIFYDDVKVPRECLVGEKNRGFYYILEALDHERMYLASKLKGELDEFIEYVKGRGSVSPVVRERLAQLSIEVEIVRLFALRIPWMLDKGTPPTYQAAMLKAFFAETEQRLVNGALQIMGSYGVLERDSKWSQLGGRFEHEYLASLENLVTRGTCEIMRNIIALRGLGLPAG